MYVYVCMHICVYVCMHICVYVCLYLQQMVGADTFDVEVVQLGLFYLYNRSRGCITRSLFIHIIGLFYPYNRSRPCYVGKKKQEVKETYFLDQRCYLLSFI